MVRRRVAIAVGWVVASASGLVLVLVACSSFAADDDPSPGMMVTGDASMGPRSDASIDEPSALDGATAIGDAQVETAESIPDGGRRVFVTDPVVPGMGFTNLTTADAYCNAVAAKYNRPGIYLAWLSTTGSFAKDRLDVAEGSHRQWYPRAGGSALASEDTLLSTGPSQAIRELANGLPAGAPSEVWTGTSAVGLVDTANCDNWSGGAAQVGVIGDLTSKTEHWTTATKQACTLPGRLYCFEK